MRKNPYMLITVEDSEGLEYEVRVPVSNEICGRCDGNGSHVHEALSVMTASDWDDWDMDEREGYFKGEYDVPCERCSGSGIVQVPDFSNPRKDPLITLAEEWYYDDLQFEADCKREREMGY